jgi:hypothetical protein
MLSPVNAMSKRTILGIAATLSIPRDRSRSVAGVLVLVVGWWSCHYSGSFDQAQASSQKDGRNADETTTVEARL